MGTEVATPSKVARSFDFAATRNELLKARHLPGYFYSSPEIFDLEVEKIFLKDWICVGRVEQFENPGDYRTMRLANEPVLISRDRKGKLHALWNVCRHRGVEVAFGQGNTKMFTCPYHAWVYELDGTLRAAPYSKEVEGYDFTNCHLPRLQIDTWAGYIFICFDPGAKSLGDYLDEDDVRKAAGFLQPENTRVADEYTFDVECNWKFIPENLMDMYHVGVIHGASFGKYFPVSDFQFQLTKNTYHAEYQSLTMAPDGARLFETMPWLKHKPEYFAFTVHIRPTFNMFARPDMLQPWFAHPIGPERTRITILTQYPEEHFEAEAFEEKNQIVKQFIRLVADEDLEMLRSLQNGVRSRGFKPGPTLKLEKAIHHLLNSYLTRMFGEDATQYSALAKD